MPNTPVTDPDIQKRLVKWRRWRSDLQAYWPDMEKMQEMYEFYKREGSETYSDVSLNSAFAIVESMISKLNDSSMRVSVSAHGQNGMALFERYVGNILEKAIYDRGVQELNGPFRKVREVVERDFLVKGNFAAEVSYCYETVKDDKGTVRVKADNPMTTPLPLKSVVFDSSKTLLSSREYFVEKYVDIDYLEDRSKVDPSWDKEAIASFKEQLARDYSSNSSRSAQDEYFISGDQKLDRKAGRIHMLEHWEGAMLTVVLDQRIKARSIYDPMKIGSHPLLLGMNYIVEGRPYAYGEINAIYKPVRAQDTIANQRIETINQYLRGAVFVDPDAGINLDMVAMMMETGGVAYGNPEMVKSLEKPIPPSVAYTETSEIQQAVERAARFSPYSSGTPNSGTDTTDGTKGGIIALQTAAEPNFQVKVDGVTDMFLTPLCYKYLPMIANLMKSTDVRYGEIQGEDDPWVGATKEILLGKPTLESLLKVGMITQKGYDAATTVEDPYSGQTFPIPGAGKASIVEVDWVLKVRLDLKSASDRRAKLQTAQSMVAWFTEMGAKFSPVRLVNFFESKMEELQGLSEVMLTQEELAQMDTGPQEQLRINVNFADLPPEGQVQAAAQAGVQINEGQVNAHAASKALMEHSAALDLERAKHEGEAVKDSIRQSNEPAPVAPEKKPALQ